MLSGKTLEKKEKLCRPKTICKSVTCFIFWYHGVQIVTWYGIDMSGGGQKNIADFALFTGQVYNK